jgi:hypothetical protein
MSKSWRDWLPVHPAADKFELLPKDQLQALADDIREHGLIERCSYQIDDDGKPELLDGRNGLDALAMLGQLDGEDLPDHLFEKVATDDPVAFIISINIHRRHLTPEQRQKHLIALIAMAPERSDREIGREARVDGKTIAKARAAGETCGTIPHVATRTDSKGRRQPASKACVRRARERRAASKAHTEAMVAEWHAAHPKTPSTPTLLKGQEALVIDQQLRDVKSSIERLVGYARSCNRVTEIISALRTHLGAVEAHDAKVARSWTNGNGGGAA